MHQYKCARSLHFGTVILRTALPNLFTLLFELSSRRFPFAHVPVMFFGKCLLLAPIIMSSVLALGQVNCQVRDATDQGASLDLTIDAGLALLTAFYNSRYGGQLHILDGDERLI